MNVVVLQIVYQVYQEFLILVASNACVIHMRKTSDFRFADSEVFCLLRPNPKPPGEHTCSGTQGNPAAMRWNKITR